MSYSVTLIVLGVLIMASGLWHTPRTMRRAQKRTEDRGGNPAAIETLVASRRWRWSMSAMTVAGAATMILGIVTLAMG